MAEVFNNLAKSTLAFAITNIETSLTLATGDGALLFPALSGSDFFRCILFNKTTGNIEIIKVTAISGDVCTISRAQEDIGNVTAVAYAFNAGDLIELRPTKGFFTSLAAVTTTDVQADSYNHTVDTGVADAYLVALSPAFSSYAAPMRITFVPDNTNTGASTIDVDGLGVKDITTINGNALTAGDIVISKTAFVLYDGAAFVLLNPRLSSTDVATLSGNNAFTGANTFAGTSVFNGLAAFNKTVTWKKGNNVVAAAALPVLADGNYFDVTGATTITSINTLGAGTTIKLHFNSALTLTDNGTDIILPSTSNIAVKAGDEAEFFEISTGSWRLTNYTPFDQRPGLLDEDDMTSNSDNQAVTQQSLVAYVADQITANINSFFAGTPGYIEFATSGGDGIAIQWGQDTVDGNGDGSDTFKKAFSSTPWIIVVTPYTSTSTTLDKNTSVTSNSSTGFSYRGGSSAITTRWIAIGPVVL